jgi:hypothetical protein
MRYVLVLCFESKQHTDFPEANITGSLPSITQVLRTYALLKDNQRKLNSGPYPNDIKERFEDPRNRENMKWSIVPAREAVACAVVVMYG